MPEPKSNNADEIEIKCVFIERLKELIDEAGGDKNFAEKLNEINPKGTTDVKLLKRWTDPEKDIQITNVYLIAMACNVSVDWLLGLSAKKTRSCEIFKNPSTYGDALSVLNGLCKINVLEITDSNCQFPNEGISDEDIYVNNVTLPEYIQIKDEHLISLIQDLYRSQGLSERQFTDAWEKTLKLEINKPIQEHDSNFNHNDTKSKQTNKNKTATPVKILDHESLAKQVKDQLIELQRLNNDLNHIEFGKRVGVKKSTISGWFDKHLPKKIYYLYKIAKEFNVHADWILGLEETSYTTIPWKDEVYTYGSVLSMLKHLIDKGTIGFVEKYSLPFDDPDDNYIPVIENLLAIDDPFLFYLLLKQNIKEQYTTDAFKKTFEELLNKYKDTLLLSFTKDTRYGSYKTMRSDSNKILRNLWDGKIEHDIDLDKLYKDLQRLSNPKPAK